MKTVGSGPFDLVCEPPAYCSEANDDDRQPAEKEGEARSAHDLPEVSHLGKSTQLLILTIVLATGHTVSA